MNTDWQKYKTIEKFGYRNRLMVACVALVIVFVVTLMSPMIFGNAKRIDWFEGNLTCNPLVALGIFCLFFLYLYLIYAWLTKGQTIWNHCVWTPI